MIRILAGAAAMLLMMIGGIFAWESIRSDQSPIPDMPAMLSTPAAAQTGEPAPPLPVADPKTREEKRFGRYDKDKDGAITREEYLASRRKAFAKLDLNGNGTLEFDEYAVKSIDKFVKADGDKSGAMNAKEFATTAVIRKAKPAACKCPPVQPAAPVEPADDEEN